MCINWIRFSNRIGFSFITKCNEILNVRYRGFYYIPRLILLLYPINLLYWSCLNGLERLMEETELLHPNSEQITFHPLKNPWHWIVTSSENVCFSSLVRLSNNMGSIDFSIIYQSYFEADCIIIGLRHFKSYIFWTTSTCHFQTKKSRADFYLFYKTRITTLN